MSTVLTKSALQHRSNLELQTLLRKAHYDLACTRIGSEERRNALSTIENITAVMRQRALCPRPPGF
jgi:hypothetical protein